MIRGRASLSKLKKKDANQIQNDIIYVSNWGRVASTSIQIQSNSSSFSVILNGTYKADAH